MMDDLDRMMDVMQAAFDPQWGEAWNRAQLGSSLAMPHTDYSLIAENGERPPDGEPAAGFTLVKIAPGEEELLLIAVKPHFRGRGLGRTLLDKLGRAAKTRGAQRIFLEMRANNPAERLYRSCGFKPVGERKNYYTKPNGEKIDAITFVRNLVE